MEEPSTAGDAPGTLAERLDAVFGALGSDVRRTLLDRLAEGALSAGDLAAAVTVSWPAVSKHLRVLEEAGLVARAREGRAHRIARRDGPLAEAMAWLQAQGVPPVMEAAAPAAAGPLRPPAGASVPTPSVLTPSAAAARALAAALAPAARVVARALAPAAEAPGAGPADYLAFVLRRRLGTEGLPAGKLDPAGPPDLRAELAAGLAALEALEAALAPDAPAPPPALEALTAGATRLTWLLGQHPLLADLGLLARRPTAA